MVAEAKVFQESWLIARRAREKSEAASKAALKDREKKTATATNKRVATL